MLENLRIGRILSRSDYFPDISELETKSQQTCTVFLSIRKTFEHKTGF
jgi:hypothetical protein